MIDRSAVMEKVNQGGALAAWGQSGGDLKWQVNDHSIFGRS